MQNTDRIINHQADTIQEAFRLARQAMHRVRYGRNQRQAVAMYAGLALDNLRGALIRKFWDGRTIA